MAQTLAQKIQDAKSQLSTLRSQAKSATQQEPQTNTLANIEFTEHTQKFFDYLEQSFLLDLNTYKNKYGAENIQERTYELDMPDITGLFIPEHLPLSTLTGLAPLKRYTTIQDGFYPNSGEHNLLQIFAREMNFIEENLQFLSYSVATTTRMKKALDAVSDGRIADAITTLRDAKRDDPHNHSLAFVLSQLCFYRSINGMTEFLPEARSEAKKSCHFTEDAHPQMLRLYRYAAVMNEYHFDKEKSLEMMRSFYLTNPESILEKDGLLAHRGLHIKSWLLMSKTSGDLWTNFEHEGLTKVATSAPGGVLLYVRFFRERFKKYFTEDIPPELKPYLDIEEKLKVCKGKYVKLLSTATEFFDDRGKLKEAPEHYWTLEHRYLRTFLGAVSKPTLDQIFLHCSLDARRYARNCAQNEALQKTGLSGTNYWQAWGMCVSADRATQTKSVIPVEAVGQAAGLLKTFDDLINVLEEHERSIIDDEKWEIIKPYMPDYQYQAFIHVGAGPKAYKTPEDPYYLPLFRKWSRVRPEHPIPSSIMKEHAANGAFTSMDEVISAFIGIYKIIDDPIHGLKARAKAALKVLLEDKEKHHKETKKQARKILIKSHMNDYWWLYFIIAPVAVITFFIMVSSGSYSAAFSNLGFILLLLASAGIVGYLFISGKKKAEEAGELSQEDDLDDDFQKLEEVSTEAAKEQAKIQNNQPE